MTGGDIGAEMLRLINKEAPGSTNGWATLHKLGRQAADFPISKLKG